MYRVYRVYRWYRGYRGYRWDTAFRHSRLEWERGEERGWKSLRSASIEGV